jgi:lipid-A-disaccharide synthase
VVPHLAERIRSHVAGWTVPVTLVEPAEKQDAFAAADVALVKSGTGSVEVAVAGLPAIITQRFNPLTWWTIWPLIKTDVSIVNVLLGRRVQPILLQWDCNPETLSAALLELFMNPAARQDQIEGGRKVAQMLGGDDVPPSRRAARAVLASISRT